MLLLFGRSKYTRWIGTTNNAFCAPLDDGGLKRRFCPLECSSKYVGNGTYFENLKSTLNQDAADHFYSYLRNYPMDGKDITNFPVTELALDMVEASMTSSKRFIKECLNNFASIICYLHDCPEHDAKSSTHKIVFTDDLYRKYREWCSVNEIKNPVKINYLGREGLGANGLVKYNNGNPATFNGKRGCCWYWPIPLS